MLTGLRVYRKKHSGRNKVLSSPKIVSDEAFDTIKNEPNRVVAIQIKQLNKKILDLKHDNEKGQKTLGQAVEKMEKRQDETHRIIMRIFARLDNKFR